jgi:hypothetical protein
VAAILPWSEYWAGAIDEYSPPFPREPDAVPVVDSIPVVVLIAVTFASFAKKFTEGAFTPKL